MICLGVLYSGSKSGYELHKTINTDLKHFQTASFGALYPALGKLEAKKFIASDGRINPIQTSSLPKKFILSQKMVGRFLRLGFKKLEQRRNSLQIF